MLKRFGFAGTPEFAATILAALLDSDRAPVAVWTQPDRRAGRGRQLAPGPVKRLAQAHGLPVLQPVTLKDAAARSDIAALNLDYLLVAAYGLLLPPAVLDLPRYGCVNVHASLLPRWRGAAPIQAAIRAGDRETGITIMQMDAGLDTGAILHACPCGIRDEDTGGTLTARLAALGGACLLEALAALEGGRVRPTAQDDARASYAGRLDKADAMLDFRRPAAELARSVRAFDPWPVAWTTVAGERLRVWRADGRHAPAEAPPGTVIGRDGDGMDVATGDGVLRLLEVQRAGGRRVGAAEYARTHGPAPGTVLGADAAR